MRATAFIGVDWGTTNCRAMKIAADGAVIDERAGPNGILNVASGDFAAALERQVGDWIAAAPDAAILLCGMIGSRQGWVEAPYASVPARLDDLAGRLATAEAIGRYVRIIPGVSGPALSGGFDVMRGEETQVFGALAALPPSASRRLICLPGTHSKWVLAEGDGPQWRIMRFATFMTGETFAVLKYNSILGRMMEDGPDDEAAFDDGLARSGGPGGVLHHLFMVRTDGLFDAKPPTALASFMSGLLIGHELRAALAWAGEGPIAIVGAPDLSRLYARALSRLSRRTEIVAAETATALGLLKIAAAARLIRRADEA